MQINGYEVGDKPTAEELETFRRVKRHLVAKVVAETLRPGHVPEPLTQREFDFIVMVENNGDTRGVEWPSIAVLYLDALTGKRINK